MKKFPYGIEKDIVFGIGGKYGYDFGDGFYFGADVGNGKGSGSEYRCGTGKIRSIKFYYPYALVLF